MCGIAGVMNFGSVVADERPNITRVRDAMTHRGPDGAGLYESPDRRVVFGHRRLSIVDLSDAGRQPMTNEDGTVWVTFNGEIYNHAAHRPGLVARGHRFASRTDTEAILHLYEEHGPACVDHLDGMFAFAVWDEARGRLLLARDRLGKKPLYYTVRDGRLVFASELTALLAYPGVTRELDLTALNHYLTFSSVPAPLTLVAGVRKLSAAHRLICDRRGAVTVERYWSPLDGRDWDEPVEEGEAVERVRDLLKRAVAKRLMSDVPVGAFLSGGVDSSANVALMTELTAEPLRTFSAGFEGFAEAQNFHDLPYARRVAARFGCRHSEVTITARDCQDYLVQAAGGLDEPLGDPACVPMHFVSRHAREQGVTVVLVGEGSDEVFAGYPDMARTLGVHGRQWRMVRRLPRLARRALVTASRVGGKPAGRVDLLRRAAEDEPLYWGLDVVFWDTEKRQLLRPDARRRLGPGAAGVVRGYYDEILRRRPGADFLQQMSYVELSNRLPELLLMRVDKFSMAHSLEARAPFLDADLVSYALSLPARLKIRGGRTKHVLKEALAPVLPAEVIGRPKQGFRVPLPEWLRGELSGWAEHQLLHSSIHRLGLFEPGYVRGLWDRHRAGVQDHSFDLWCLIGLAAWYDRWIGG